MDVYISADIEGVAGIVSWTQCIPGQPDFEMGRRLMINEVNAAIDGAFRGGATRVVVNDSHHRMTNLLPDAIDPRARLILGGYKPMYMLQGLDSGFDAAFFLGYHGAVGEPEAVLAHSYSPSLIWEARVDGRMVGELGINAMVADYFGVPVRLVTGDQVVAVEARERIAGVHVAEVKRSFSRYSAENLSPEESCAVIRNEAEACLHALPTATGELHAVQMELTFLLSDMASIAEWIAGVERVGPRTVQYVAEDGLQAYQKFFAILMLAKSLVQQD